MKNTSSMHRRSFRCLLLAVALLPPAAYLSAQTTWDGGGGVDTSWGTAANWNTDTLPAFDGTDSLSITTGYAGNTALTLGADRSIGRLTFGGGSTATSLSGNTLRLNSTTTTAAAGTALWNANTSDGVAATINSALLLQSGSAGTYTGYIRENNNSNGGTTFNGAITQGAGENWTLRFSQASSRGNFFLANSGNSFSEFRNDNTTVSSRIAGAFGGALITLAGGNTGTATSDHYNTPVGNNITMIGNATWSSGIQTRLTGTMDQNTRTLTYAGAGLTYVDYASIAATTGITTVSGATVAVASMSKLSPGTLNLEGARGVMVLSGTSGNGVPTWSDFSAARTYNAAGGVGNWRINSGVSDGSAGGFAARGADLVIPASGAGLSNTTFARHLALGSTATLDGVRYANNAVRIQTDIAYAANDNYEISVLGLGTTVSGNNWTFGGPVHELSGVISGDNIGILPMQNRGNPGILRISNPANSLTNVGGASAWVLGNTRSGLTTQGGRSVGGGNHFDGSDVVVIFTSDGAFGGAADVLVNQVSSDNAPSTGYLFFEDTTGLSTTFGRNFRVNATNTTATESAGFGSWGGVVDYEGNGTSTGVIDLTGANVNLLVSAENGSRLNLGTVGGDTASLVNNRSGTTLTYQIGGSGTVALNNVAFSGSFAGTPSWFVREGTLQVNQALNQGNISVASGAVLEFGDGGTTGSLDTSRTIASSGTVSFRQSDTVTQGVEFGTSAISGSGGLAQNGSGTLVLNAALAYTGATAVNNGTLEFNGATHTTGTSYSINGGTLDLQAGTLTTPTLTLASGGFDAVGGTVNAATFTVSGGTLAHSTGTMNVQNLFHVNGSGGTLQMADLADTTDGSAVLRFTADTGGVGTIELTDATPFGRYGNSPAAWVAEWTIDLNTIPALQQDDFSNLTLMSSSLYNLNSLNGLLTITAFNGIGGPMTYNNVMDGDTIFLSSGVALAEYTVNFSGNSFVLEFEGAFAIPEPGTLSMVALALLVLRRQFRKRCLAA